MRTVTAVEPEWLADQGPMFFSMKESYKERLEKRKKEAEDQMKMEDEMTAKLAADADKKTREKQKAEEEGGEAARKKRARIATPGLSSGSSSSLGGGGGSMRPPTHVIRAGSRAPTPRRRFGL